MKKFVLLIAFSFSLFTFCSAQYDTLHNFSYTDGSLSVSSLTLYHGVLYGSTWQGGSHTYGDIFAVDTNGHRFRDIHDFGSGWDGTQAKGALTPCGHLLYGTTLQGGRYNSGMIFSIDTDGNGYRDLFDFGNGAILGDIPTGGLILCRNRLYGIAEWGGVSNGGCIYSIDTNGSGIKELFDLSWPNGATPMGSLTLVGNKFYGLTMSGGPVHDSGCVFSIDTNGSGYRILHNFNGTDGFEPWGDLLFSKGKLFGMTTFGGPVHDSGCIFSIDSSGSNFKLLHNFNGVNGKQPENTLTLSGSTLYGITVNGGLTNGGCIFSIDTNGSGFTDMFDFNSAEGANPWGALILSGKEFYGTTAYGGSQHNGVVFKFEDTNIVVSGIKQLTQNDKGIKVYPNPSNGIFQIQANSQQLMANSQVEVYNSLGQKVYAASLNPSKGGTSVTNISLPFGETRGAGIYFYRVITETGNLVGEGKLIIQ